jgi:uncharacterized protein with beta-barrel porin domain
VEALLTEPGDPDALGFLNAAGSYVLNRPDPVALLDTYECYVADELLAAPDATLLSGLVFADRLGRCDGPAADAAVFRDGARCGWFGTYGRRLERDGSGVGPRYDETVAGGVFGAAAESDGGLRHGGGLGWETGSISMPAASGDVTRVQLGGFAEGRVGAATLGATLSGGWFGSDLRRTVETPDGAADARSDPDGFYAAAHLSAARRFDRGPVFAEPPADVGVVWLTQAGFSERGADGYGVTVDRLERTVLTLNPAVTVGHAFAGGGAATLKLGAVGLVGPDPDIDAAFVGAGAGPWSFRVADDASDLYGQIEAGVDMDLGAGGRLAAQAGGLFADDQRAYGLSLRLSWAF